MIPKVLDLFSGIGGFALAFEAAGFETAAFSEIEPYPCKVLAQHWPDVPNLGDIRGINGEDYRGAVDVICGGFPCQDISTAGKGAGLEGERSGLWFEMLRVIRGARPAFCLIENVPALRTRGGDRVLTDLEESGYTGRPFVVGAVHAGAPHRRLRTWIVAYANQDGPQAGLPLRSRPDDSSPSRSGENVANLPGPGPENLQGRPTETRSHGRGFINNRDWWATEPALGRVANGIPNRAHRIKALGNSIVPAVAYPFAKFIFNSLTGGPQAEPPNPLLNPPSPNLLGET